MSSQLIDPFHLVSASVPSKAAAKPAPQPTNHVVVIDCSGSMYYELPLIRAQMKDKLPRLLSEGDTISIIWFSSRGECGTLVKGEPVATLKDLADVNKAIDRWLKPVGLTGFKDPLVEAAKVAAELGGVCSLFFMSDGYDNQWSKADIVKAAQALTDKFASTTWVEYGNYCNHPLMVELAETTGGQVILSEDFRRFEPNFEAAMQKRAVGAKRVEVEIKGDAIKSLAFALDEGALLTFKVEDGKVAVPEHVSTVWYLSETAKNSDSLTFKSVAPEVQAAVYAAIAVFAQRVASDIVLPLLKFSGDVRLIHQFSGCFGKQKYAEFVGETTKAAFDASLRLVEGYDPSSVPDENAFTVLHLLKVLAEDEGNYLLVDSKDFEYKKIGRGVEQQIEYTEDEQKEIDDLTAKLAAGPSAAEAKKLQKKLDEITGPKQPLKFTADPMPKGVEIRSLVYNEERPNVSVSVRREGTVDLKARKAGGHKKVPDQLRSFIFRNYAIVRDGIINVDRLPVRVTKDTVQKLLDAGMPIEAIQNPTGETLDETRNRIKKASADREVNLVLDLRALPIINRAMVKSVSAKDTFETAFELVKARAAQKVYNTVKKEKFPEGKTSEGFAVLFGAEEAAWLKEQGITDYSGFNPGGKQAEAKDVYIGKELAISLKGLSTIPSLKDYTAKVASGKALTASQALLKPAADKVEKFLASDTYKDSKNQPKVLEAWLDSEAEATKKQVRDLLFKVSQIGFSVVVGQTWFSEFSSLDENTLTLKVDGQDLLGTVAMKEIEVEV